MINLENLENLENFSTNTPLPPHPQTMIKLSISPRPQHQSKIILFLCQLLFIATLIIACQNPNNLPTNTPQTSSNCIQNYDSKQDYFPNKAKITQAKGFTVEYHKNYKKVTVTNPWKNAKTGFQYILVQCGTPAPQGFPQNQIITVPINSIITLSTTHLPHLAKLGVVDKLIGLSDPKIVNTPEVVSKIKASKIPEIGSNASVNIEKILELNPDLITTYGTGNQQTDSYPKLQEAGLKVAINAEYMENTPLGRSEWLKFTSLFFNKEEIAEKIFTDITQKYQAIAKKAASIKNRPTAILGFNFKGTWYMPGGDSYTAKYLQDAGANYLWINEKSTGSLPLSFEKVLENGTNAQYWLNFSQTWKTTQDILAADNRYSEFQAFKKGNLYNNDQRLNKNGGNDYWESGISNPDIVLTDLIKIFHPQILPEHKLTYYRKVENRE